jgi:hypothetical protein
METIIKTDQKTITIELAEAIANYNVAKVANLLSDNGDFGIQNDKDELL